MAEVRAMTLRGGEAVERVALDAEEPAQEASAFTWLEVLNPVERDFAALQERFEPTAAYGRHLGSS